MFSRNILLWGNEIQDMLKSKHVALFGLGAVGGQACEILTRSGIGKLTIVDFDKVDKSNINRQIIALNSTVGLDKTSLFESRLKDINPEINLRIFNDFYTEQLSEKIFADKPDAVIDAIDTVKSKIALLKYCKKNKIITVSSFGAGNKLDPTLLRIKDISEIGKIKCTFASNLIRIAAKENITEGITVVYSEETRKPTAKIQKREEITTQSGEQLSFDKITPGSVSFVTAVAGCYCAYAAIKKLTSKT